MTTDWNRLRSDIYLRDNGICWICNSFVSLDDYDLGHLIDRTNGGHDDYDNLAVMHRNCNHSKPYHNTLEEALRWKLTFSIPNLQETTGGIKRNIRFSKGQPRQPKETIVHEIVILNKKPKLANRPLSSKTLLKQQAKLEECKSKIKPGTLCWLQGRPRGVAMWKVLPPPYRKEDMFILRLTPPGVTDSGINGLEDTLQIIGGGELKEVVTVHNGAVDYIVSNDNGKLNLVSLASKYSNSGSKTVGQGKHQIPVSEWLYFKNLGMPYNEFIENYNPSQS